jgi:arylsulfatase A-like enzyme/Flp pilus assembly protein TadD
MLGLLLLAAAPNLVFITIDTLRADHAGAYGYAAAETKTLDRLAREGVLLEDAVVQVPQTRPSHACLFTGLYPYEHGLRDNYSPRLAAGHKTLAQHLKLLGYSTAAFVGGYPVSRSSGLDQGFSVYDDPFGEGERSTVADSHLERPAARVVDSALRWLGTRPAGPFFVWVHLFDPHAPYKPPAPWGARFAKSPYDGEVAYADAEMGRIVDWLEERGLRRDTLVVATSDHGEGLGEHGEQEHLLFLYDSTLRVPALFSWPGTLRAGARLGGQFRSIDFVPTVLALLGRPALPTSGISRADSVRAGTRIPDNESYAESLYGQLHYGWAPLLALRGEGWKYIEAPRAELYHLIEDAHEMSNVLDQRSQVSTAMRARLAPYRAAGGPQAAKGTIDPDAAERLAALGYVGGGFFTGIPTGADPKDKVAWYESYRSRVATALRLHSSGDLDGSLRLLEELDRPQRDPSGRPVRQRSFNVSYTLGRVLLEKRRYSDAVAPLQEAIALVPSASPAYVYLAEAQTGAGRPAEARAALERGLAQAPGNPELLRAKGVLLQRQGDLAGARAALEKARVVDPGNALLRVDLSTLLRNGGDAAGARSEAEAAVKLGPNLPETHVALGLALGAGGREAEAATEFTAALRLSKDFPSALFYLGASHLRAGRPDQALPLLERLAARAPDYPGGREALEAARRLASGAAAPRPAGEAAGGRRADPTLRLQLLRVEERAQAEALWRRILSGEDFGALARQNSIDATRGSGGDLGVLRLTDLAEPLRTAARELAPGQTSAPIEAANGWVLLRRAP